MAISAIHHYIIRSLRDLGLLRAGGALLELGESNWYNDLDPLALLEDIDRYVPDAQRRQMLSARLQDVVARQERRMLFDVAKVFVEVFYAPSHYQAIDQDGTELAQKLDLNQPITLDRRFDVIVNHGTAEHIFNIAQVFRTIHDYTMPGGLMIHESPLHGWIDHGFFALQPTLFFDLAARNEYQLEGMYIANIPARTLISIQRREDVYARAKAGEIPENAMMFTVLRKGTAEREFGIPQQGYYDQTLSPTGYAAWRELR